MKVVICGDRHWSDKTSIKEFISALEPSLVIHGGAQGADSLAGEAAKELGIPVMIVEAEWSKYGKAAGPIRNKKMLDLEPEFVVAFHANLDKSKGTKNCLNQAEKLDIPILLIGG